MLTVAVLLVLVLLRWGLLLLGAALIVRPVSDCPACFQPTVPIRRRWLSRLAPWLEWRWCMACSWKGPGRRSSRRELLAGRGAVKIVPDARHLAAGKPRAPRGPAGPLGRSVDPGVH